MVQKCGNCVLFASCRRPAKDARTGDGWCCYWDDGQPWDDHEEREAREERAGNA